MLCQVPGMPFGAAADLGAVPLHDDGQPHGSSGVPDGACPDSAACGTWTAGAADSMRIGGV